MAITTSHEEATLADERRSDGHLLPEPDAVMADAHADSFCDRSTQLLEV